MGRVFLLRQETAPLSGFVPAMIVPEAPMPPPSSATSPVSARVEIVLRTDRRIIVEGAADMNVERGAQARQGPRALQCCWSRWGGVKVWLATGRTDMRKGFASLSLLVQEVLRRDRLGSARSEHPFEIRKLGLP